MLCLFFFNDTATTEIYTLSLHDALPISKYFVSLDGLLKSQPITVWQSKRSEEHTSELQSLRHLVCRLLLEKKKKHHNKDTTHDSIKQDVARCARHCGT